MDVRRFRVRPASMVVALVVMSAPLSACQSASNPPAAGPAAAPSHSATPLAGCPLLAAPAAPQILLGNLPAPDDLAYAADGRLLFSDITAGTVSALDAAGAVSRVAGGLSAPEGIVVRPDGQLLVAEQGRNRVVRIDPQSHVVSAWRAFPNRTGRDGIDGIGPLLPNGDVIVPDSPNGVVWRVSGDGATASQIAAGMVRPVGATVDTTGRIFVADEGGALWVLEPGRRRFATLPTPDDVLVAADGHLLINTLGDNAIHELDTLGHQVGVLTGISQPQGIALDGADNLAFTDFTHGRIERVIRTFVLDPAVARRSAAGTFLVCPVIRRASGFTGSLRLDAAGPAGSIRQVRQPGTDSSGALEVGGAAAAVRITVASGAFQLQQTVQLTP